MWDGRQWTPSSSQRGLVGCCVRALAGMICPSVTASTRKRVRALHALGLVGVVRAHLRRPGPGQEELLPDARFHHRAGAAGGGYRAQKGSSEDAALGRSRVGLSTSLSAD